MIHFQNKKTIVIALVGVFMFLFVLVLLVIPAMREMKRLNNEMLNRRIELERLYKRGQSTKKVAEDLKNITGELPYLKHSILKRGQELEFITALESVARAHQLVHRLEFVKREGIPREENLESEGVVIGLQGRFLNVYQYLAELDRLPFYLLIQNLTVQSDERAGTFGVRGGGLLAPTESTESAHGVSVSIEAYMYWKPQ